MITRFEVENFKGIGARQQIDFAPLTLLFGANSAGKSTILQALLYFHELIERGFADVDRTELGGDVVELGGFARLVHRHELERPIVLRAEFETPGGLERFGREITKFPFPNLDDDVESAWLELTIRWRTAATFRGPVVDRAVIGVNGDAEPLVWLDVGASLRDGEPIRARVNLGHPVIAEPVDSELSESLGIAHVDYDTTIAWDSISIPDDVPSRDPDAEGTGGGSGTGDAIGLGDGSGFSDGRSLPVFALKRARLSALPAPGEALTVVPVGDDNLPSVVAAAEQVRTFLEMVVLGTTAQLASLLRESIYIGPLRAVPPRGFLYERTGRIANWADGLAAWDILLGDRLKRVDETNDWLRRLDARCQVVVQQLFHRGAEAEDLSQDHVDKTVRRLLLDANVGTLVLPSEVGAGISQVVPVIVAALENRAGLSLIEQPEIHIHPRLQTDLGDLFIVASARRQFVVETHSEHLILRALRRIRETSSGELKDNEPPFAPGKLSVIYVEATPSGTTFKRLRVNEVGEFVDRWPHGFFDERFKEIYGE